MHDFNLVLNRKDSLNTVIFNLNSLYQVKNQLKRI